MTKMNYIGGRWEDSAESDQNINPSDVSDIIDVHARASIEQVLRAIQCAREASRQWSLAGVQARFDALDKIGSAIIERKAELGELLSREEGKTLPEGIGEVVRAGQIFKFFAAEAIRISGEVIPSVRPGVRVEVTREAVGVVGLITPWNFPIAIPAWKIAPAIAYGNAVVFKPAELVPGCAHALAEIISESGLPAGVFNLVNGRGADVGNALVESPLVDAISFTGSRAVGEGVATTAIKTFKKIQLEMGGKNPLLVLDDADLALAVECAVQGSYYSTGQRCTASSRIIVEAGIHDEFVKALTRRVRALNVGHALDESTDVGPVASLSQLRKVLDYVQIGRSEGANLVCGGERISRDTEGYFVSSALFVDARNDMKICQEEIFGPVAAVIKASNFEEALSIANDTDFGLTSGICTRSLEYASQFKLRSEAGMVMVNVPTAGVDYHVPFGGRKGSSFGPKEQGTYAREFYTQIKTAYTQG